MTTIRNLYLYTVCLVTLVISIFALHSLVTDLVSLIFYGAPSWAMSASSVQDYRQQLVLSIVGATVSLLVAIPLFVYHWRKAQEDRRLDISDGNDVT
jgi:hypothetical protein